MARADVELLHPQRQRVGPVAPGAGRLARLGVAEQALGSGVPLVGVEGLQVDVRRHADGRLRRRLHHADAAAQHPRHLARHITQVVRLQQRAEFDVQAVAQRRRHRARFERGLVPQEERRLGALVQRRRQVDRQADEVAGHQQLGPALREAQVHAVGRLPAQGTGQARGLAEVGGTPQAFGAGIALAAETDRPVGLQAAVEGELAAEQARARARHREVFVGEGHAAFCPHQQRAVGRDAHVVAGQDEAALDLRGRRVDEGDRQLELEVGHAGRCAGVERMADPAAHRGVVHELQHLGQRPVRAGFEPEHTVAFEVADGALHAAPFDLADLRPAVSDRQRAAVDDQFGVRARQHRPRRGPGRRGARSRLVRHVGEARVLDLGGNAELAVRAGARVVIRKIRQVTLDPKARARELASLDRVLDVAARGLRDVERQVTPGAGHHAVRQPAVEFQLARIAPATRQAGAGAGAP